VVISSQGHDVEALGSGRLYRRTTTRGEIAIGSNVWIASSAVIAQGVSVGDGSIVAAGAVVVSDVPEKVLVAGVPARIIRSLTAGPATPG
jgi:acetyltransferase-like isoleucine patch superfamily enzyme